MSSIRLPLNAAGAGLVALLISAGPAFATGEIICTATDGSNAEIHMVVGRLPVLHVVNATASDGIETWMTAPQGGAHPIVYGQGYMDDRQVVADFTDPNVERIVVSLRLHHASGDKSFAEAGILSFEGVSVFPVQCENG